MNKDFKCKFRYKGEWCHRDGCDKCSTYIIYLENKIKDLENKQEQKEEIFATEDFSEAWE